MWLFAGSTVKAITQLIIIAVLARLLSPKDFGLLATAMIVVRFIEMIATIGVGPALIQKDNINEKHISAAFSFIIIIGLTLYLLLSLLNPYIALFFNSYELIKILNLISIILPFNMFSQISYSLLQKQFKFKNLAGWDILSYILGYGVFGIPLAYLGFGIFSLIWAVIIQSISYALFLFLIRPYSLKIRIYKKETFELLSLGGGFALGDIFNYFARNGDYLIVGKFIGIDQLGLYSRAYTLMNAVDRILGTVINKVMFSTFSKIQDDKKYIIDILNRSFGVLFFVLIPASIYCYFYAEEIIILLLGHQWLDVVFPYKILLFGMFFRVGYKLLATCMKGIGSVYQNMFIQFIYMLLIVVGSFLVKDYGIIGVSGVVSISLLIHFSIQIIYLNKLGYINPKSLLIKIWSLVPLLTIITSSLFINDFLFKNYSSLVSGLFSGISIILMYFYLIKSENVFFITKDVIWLKQKIYNKA